MEADPGYGAWRWADAMAELCSTANDPGQVFACILPPSEGAKENNPGDSDMWHPAAKPGMVQAAQRMSNLSRSCPMVRGMTIDDFCQHGDSEKPRQRCHKVTEQGMHDIKAALQGKPVNPLTGAVNHSGIATTPHLQVRKTPSWPRSWANFSLF
jgi:hypothetical protein